MQNKHRREDDFYLDEDQTNQHTPPQGSKLDPQIKTYYNNQKSGTLTQGGCHAKNYRRNRPV
jgi:hypothetical protein